MEGIEVKVPSSEAYEQKTRSSVREVGLQKIVFSWENRDLAQENFNLIQSRTSENALCQMKLKLFAHSAEKKNYPHTVLISVCRHGASMHNVLVSSKETNAGRQDAMKARI